MPSIERFIRLREEIARREALRREADEAEKYLARSNEIKAMRERLAAALASIRVLRGHHIEVAGLKDATSALTTLQNYQRKVAENAGESGREHGFAKRALEPLTSNVEESAAASLRRVIDEIPAVEEAFLRQVENNPLYKTQVADIRAAHRDLNREVASAGSSAKDLEAFLRKRDELRGLADRLKPADFPQEVLDFFKAVRQGGAPLEKFTETVRQWLEQRGQLNSIRLTVVSG